MRELTSWDRRECVEHGGQQYASIENYLAGSGSNRLAIVGQERVVETCLDAHCREYDDEIDVSWFVAWEVRGSLVQWQ